MFSSENINGRLEWGLCLRKNSWNLWRESHRSSETCYMKNLRKRSADNPMIPEVVDLQAVTRVNNWEWGDEETEQEAVVLCRDKTYRLNNSVTLFWWILLSQPTTTAACLVEDNYGNCFPREGNLSIDLGEGVWGCKYFKNSWYRVLTQGASLERQKAALSQLDFLESVWEVANTMC